MRPTFEHTYAEAVPALSTDWSVPAAPAPQLVVLNAPLADELGWQISWLRSEEGLRLLTGTAPDGARTTAQAYAGHQFGGYSPALGDGRALLLGEVVDAGGARRDVHLKGSGRTPFARRGDGKAVLGPMLREYLVSEAMYALGVPTTRSLAVVTTGEQVARDGRMQPGAVLARVASSHLRVGTVQYATASGDETTLRALLDYTISRLYPEVAEADRPYLALFEAVALRQARLVARWMSVGFIHGVMNTDNTTLSGQTIDYGPCAFMDSYDPATVFSSIDYQGRYAYGNQPAILQWNLARLAEAMLPVLSNSGEKPDETPGENPQEAIEAAQAVLGRFAEAYLADYADLMAAKLGLPEASATSGPLVNDLLELMQEHRVDFTLFFRTLGQGQGRQAARSLFDEPHAFDVWADRRDALLVDEPDVVAARMKATNPVYIPRNHRVEEALTAAEAGDMAPFERLLEAVTHPYDERPEFSDLAGPAPEGGPAHVTYCGT
ncbi:MAG: YdiU family protein [Dermatophilus congolensis]|nr:YdiU family protein [Dermatophilus congolensis]